MAFLANYTYALGVADLIPFGAAEYVFTSSCSLREAKCISRAFEAGFDFYNRYSALLSDSEEGTPFVRVSYSDRVVDTESNFSAGFTAASASSIHLNYDSHQQPLGEPSVSPVHLPPPIFISEAEDANNTIDITSCPLSRRCNEKTQRGEWIQTFAPPITRRLNAGVVFADPENDEERVEIEDKDVQNLMLLCAFETLALNPPNEEVGRASPFCDLFEEDEWEWFEYGADLEKYYNTG